MFSYTVSLGTAVLWSFAIFAHHLNVLCVCAVRREVGQSTGIKADAVGCDYSMLTRGGDTFLGLDDRISRDVLSLLTFLALFIQ